MFPLPNPLRMHPQYSEDQVFLNHLYRTRRTDLQQLHASPEVIDQLISLQQLMQIKTYEHQFPDAQYFIIHFGEQAIGQIIIDVTKSYLHLIDIALLPAFQGRGIGHQLVQSLLTYASALTYDVHLSVQKNNIVAKNLYTSQGFKMVNEDDVFEKMIWNYH